MTDAETELEELGRELRAEREAHESGVREIERLREALEHSVRVQSHYAWLLNMCDGGQRMRFDDADTWLNRLKELKEKKARETADVA